MIRTLRLSVIALCCASTAGHLTAQVDNQNSQEVLFSVDGVPVMVSEFDYIYAKTNGDSANYSRESLTEYLDLYMKFKLKVARARDMGLDTVPALQRELAGYRQQLADSYLIDEQVTEPLAHELYDRMGQDVDVLHLAVSLPADGVDTAAAFTKIVEASRLLAGGADWQEVAVDLSSDPSAKSNGGAVGYISAPLPEGLYALENVVYETPIGETSPVVRSTRAYHIVRPLAKRPARGEVEAAHIFLRTPKAGEGDAAAVKVRIDSIYGALQAGADFEALARTLSQDTRSAPRDGYIGYFGINRYEKPLEDAAFNTKEGEYSAPVETRVGWHIVKRIGSRTLGTWPEERPALTARVKRLTRFEVGKDEMAAQLRGQYAFRQNEQALTAYTTALPDSFLDYRWKPGTLEDPTLELFSFGGEETVTITDFQDYLRRAAADRARAKGSSSPAQLANSLYDRYVTEKTIAYAEQRLDEDNLPFSNLMREYREGILLFEATKQNVWDAAGSDTVGLESFYREHTADYAWDKRVRLDEYTVATEDQDQLADILKYARKHSPQQVLAKYNASDSTFLVHSERSLERGRDATVDAVQWRKGQLVPLKANASRGTTTAGVISEILAPSPKRLDEARGYVIADYQDELERRWVKELTSEYEVVTNEVAFEQLVRSTN